MRALLVAALVAASGCAVTPTHVYDLMDAPDDEGVESAVVEAAGLASRRGVHPSVRQAAARTLGRLRSDDPRAVAALEVALRPAQAPALRRQAAWALGELRSGAALRVLTQALRAPLDDETGAYVLEAVAKHYALMSRDEDTLVEVVEAMVFFAGNRKETVPAIYDLLGARTRTVGVNVRVLGNASRRLERNPSDQARAALYNACLELLDKLAASRDEILAGPSVWAPRVEAAVGAARGALDAEPDRTALLVLWMLGRLSADAEIARPAARALVGAGIEAGRRPSASARAAARLLTVWALARMQPHALGPRRAVLVDVVSREIQPAVLRLLAALSEDPRRPDGVQRVLVGGRP